MSTRTTIGKNEEERSCKREKRTRGEDLQQIYAQKISSLWGEVGWRVCAGAAAGGAGRHEIRN